MSPRIAALSIACTTTVIALILSGCGRNTEATGPTSADQTTEIQATAASSSSSDADTHTINFTAHGYAYRISPDKVIREVDNIPPGYVIPHPSFQVSLISPTDRGAKLFTDFNARFRIAYRRSILAGAQDPFGTPTDLSSCQDIPSLPEFCTFGLLAEPGSKVIQSDADESILTDASGTNIENSYAWITANSPIYIQFPGGHLRFAIRDDYQPSDFALLYLNPQPGQDPTIDNLTTLPD